MPALSHWRFLQVVHWRKKKNGCRWAQVPRLEEPDDCADQCVLCLPPSPSGCSKMWDNLTCWPATPPGQVVVLACPLIFNLLSSTQGKRPRLKPGSWGSSGGTSWSGSPPVEEVSRQKTVVRGAQAIGGGASWKRVYWH